MNKFLFYVFLACLVSSHAFARPPKPGAAIDSSAIPQIGINVPSYGGAYEFIPTLAQLQYYRSKNLLYIRLPISSVILQPTKQGDLATQYLSDLQALAVQANTLGLHLILDLHTAWGNGVLGVDFTSADFADFWSKVATAFQGYNGIYGYDLINEPQAGDSPSLIPTFQQAAVTAIRAVDTVKPIFLEANNWTSAYTWATWGPALLSVNDPNNNLIYEAHAYADRDSSGTHSVWADEVAAGDVLSGLPLDTTILVRRYTPFVSWCVTNGKKCLVGETGGGRQTDNIGWLQALDNGLAYLFANNVMFTYWAGGSIWGDDYQYTIEPNSQTGLDQTQMAVLTKYSRAPGQSYYYAYGPSIGTTGQASSTFSVMYLGNQATSTSYTLSDNSGGGTFSPSSTITSGTGFNPTATFTYTAPTNAVYQISYSTTDSSKQPYLSSIGYSTTTDLFTGLSATAKNIYSLRKIKASYMGPLVRLKRSSDNAQKDFYGVSYQVNAFVDTSAISTWANGSTLYLETWYDQSGYNQNAVSQSGYEPVFLLSSNSCPNNNSCVYLNSSRMDANSTINGDSGQTVMSVVSFPDTTQSHYLDWVFTNFYNFPDGTGKWALQGETAIDLGLQAGSWHAYHGLYNCGQTNGIKTYRDGTLVAQENSTQSSISLQYGSTLNIGYFRWYTSSMSTEHVVEIINFNNGLTATEAAKFSTDQKSYWGL